MKMVYKLVGFAALLATATVATAKPNTSWVESFSLNPATYTMSITLPKDTPAQYQSYLRPTSLRGTLRYRFAISLGGKQVRVRISNELGTTPLKIGGASIALAGEEMTALPGTMRALTFGGKADFTVPAGARLLSDPVDLDVPATAELVASVFVGSDLQSSPLSGIQMMRVDGNAVSDIDLLGAKPVMGRPIVSGVLVAADKPRPVIVAFGDSISDGGRGKPIEPHGWADVLARRFVAANKNVAVVSAGIGGNRVLRDGWGPSALARFDRDVLSVAGVSHVILLEGINDIGMAGSGSFGNEPSLDHEDLISAYQQLAARAQVHGVKIFIGTLPPFRGAPYFSEEKERQRLAVNAWIRSSNLFDGVIDFEAAIGDPAAPDRLLPRYDSGDHLHPNDAGYKAMGEAISLANFR